MSKCDELFESISAYYDGELTDFDKLLVEEHITVCENCSALLDVYREISLSINESSEDVPEALCIGVMDRINSEETPVAKEYSRRRENKKKWSHRQFLLTRLAPIAACLTVVLLVWQFWGNTRGTDDAAMPAYAPMPETAVSQDMGDSLWVMDDADYNYEHSAEAEEMPDAARGNFGENSAPSSTAGTPEQGQQNESVLIQETEWYTEQYFEYIDHAYADYLDNAYAVIIITGELPPMLIHREPESSEFWVWSEWDMVFEISRSDVSTLLAELGSRRDAVLARNLDRHSSTYAVVLFSN